MLSRVEGHPLPRLLTGVLLLGIAQSMTGPYLVLFGASRAHLSPLRIGVFISLAAVSGVAVSTWLGQRYDRTPSRAPVLLAVAASAVGYPLLTMTTSYALLLVIAAVFLGTGTAAFPQLFALARSYLDHKAPAAPAAPAAAARQIPALRSAWSLAWAIGPLAGGAVLAAWGFVGLFWVTAAAFGLVALPVMLLGPPPPAARPAAAPAPAQAPGPGPGAEPEGSARPLVPVTLSFALFHTAMFAGSIALPLYVTGALDRPDRDVGLLFSACALVEVLVALGLMLLPARLSRERVILLGLLLFVVYFALVAASSGMLVLVLAQGARGAAIAVVGALGITYFQALLPNSAGRATTLFSNTATAGSLVAGIVAGASAQAFGYRSTLLLCGLLSGVAWVLLVGARQHGRKRVPSQSPQRS